MNIVSPGLDLGTPRTGQVGVRTEAKAGARDDRPLKEALADFEALFIRQMLEVMRKGVPEADKDTPFAKGSGEKLFSDMLDGEYATIASRRPGGLGLKEALYEQMNRARNPALATEALRRTEMEGNSLNIQGKLPIKG
ncbi:MAG: rod-binding protein [Magnetococcales bacterium]|nr:rod-binding protein [Magnetococcales bacterium]